MIGAAVAFARGAGMLLHKAWAVARAHKVATTVIAAGAAADGYEAVDQLKNTGTIDPSEFFLTGIAIKYLIREAPRVRRQRFMEAVPSLCARQHQHAQSERRILGDRSSAVDVELHSLAIVQQPNTVTGQMQQYPTAVITSGERAFMVTLAGGNSRAILVQDLNTQQWLGWQQLPQDLRRFFHELAERCCATIPPKL